MKSRKPCGRPVKDALGQYLCGYERAPGKQQCVWHWLARQPADVQKRHAEDRRFRSIGNAEEQARARVPKSDWPEGKRWCSGCQSFVPLFYVSGSRCKACASSAAHGARVEATYGISAVQYDEILKRQGGRCAICRNRPRTMRLAVDHDHETDEVRGLLCKRCNHDLLGGGHDSVELLFRAIEYLLAPPAQHDGPRPTLKLTLALLEERILFLRRLEKPIGPDGFTRLDPPF